VLVLLFPEFILSLVINDPHIVGLGSAMPDRRLCLAVQQHQRYYIAAQRSMENSKLGFLVLTVSSVFKPLRQLGPDFWQFGLPALGIEGVGNLDAHLKNTGDRHRRRLRP
jgi:hypothetical protein